MLNAAQQQQNNYQNLNSRLNQYAEKVQILLDDLITEIVTIVKSSQDYPTYFTLDSERIQRLLNEYSSSVETLITNGQTSEWYAANLATDMFVNDVIEEYLNYISPTRRAAYFLVNADALAAFKQRSINGLSLSERLWNIQGTLQSQLTETIAYAIKNGTSAANLAKQVQNFIAKPEVVQRTNKTILDNHAATMRLARSEINMAYRTAEQTRWNQLDFVVGYQIILSHKHPKKDICDTLKGKYPKTFKWTGWHPCDLCFCIPILKTEKELWAIDYDDIFSTKSVNEVTDVPQNFKNYINNNKNKISKMKNKPYFIQDNPNFAKI